MTRDVREAVTRYEEIDGIITAAGLESDTAQRLLASASLPVSESLVLENLYNHRC